MPDLRFVAVCADQGRSGFLRQFTLRAAILFACMATHFATAESAPQMNADAGIEGVIVLGPTRGGPSRPGVPDTRPLAKTAFVVNKDDREVASFTTDDHGKFRVSLAPGHYVVATRERIGKLGNYGPFEVDLVAGQVKKVQWMCDTGMR